MNSLYSDILIPPLTDWSEYFHKEKNLPYYYNKITKLRTYKVPAEYKQWKEEALSIFLETTPWRKFCDDDGDAYYTHVNDVHFKITDIPPVVVDFENYLISIAKSKKQTLSADTAATAAIQSCDSNIDSRRHVATYDHIETAKPTAQPTAFIEPAVIPVIKVDNNLDVKFEYDYDMNESLSCARTDEQSGSIAGEGYEFAFKDSVVGESADIAVLDSSGQERAAEILLIETFLSKRDSILEVKAVLKTKRLRDLTEEEPEATIKRLSASYVGYASMTNIVSEWLVLAKHLQGGKSQEMHTEQLLFNRDYNQLKDQVESEIVQEIASIIKQKFNKNVADDLMTQLEENPSWLLEMMNDEIFRKSLIELYDLHSSSSLLGFCIRKISEMGHNREIAQLIRESPYLSVFNNMLIDLLNRTSEASGPEINSLLVDMKKNCTSTEYLYLYVHELFTHVEEHLANSSSNGTFFSSSHESLAKSTKNKIRRLQQELELAAIWKSSGEGKTNAYLEDASLFALQIILAGTNQISQAQLQQQLQFKSSNLSPAINAQVYDILKSGSLSQGHINRIFLYYFRTPVTEPAQIELTYDAIASINSPFSLLRHPQVLKLATATLMNPSRHLSIIEKKKLVRLLTLACYWDHDCVYPEISERDTIIAHVQFVENSLTSIPDLCMAIYEMASGVTVDSVRDSLFEAIREPIVSMAALQWLRLLCTDKSFVSKQEYQNLHPIFFQLLADVSKLHPLQRPDSFELLAIILDNLRTSSSSASKEDDDGTMTLAMSMNISERVSILLHDAYSCLYCIMSTGYVSMPMEYLCNSVERIDLDLVRHIVSLLLDGINPPYSQYFARKLVSLLGSENIRKALHFNGDQRPAAQLLQFQEYVATHNLLDLESENLLQQIIEVTGVNY